MRYAMMMMGDGRFKGHFDDNKLLQISKKETVSEFEFGMENPLK
jgi:hypothetical protein